MSDPEDTTPWSTENLQVVLFRGKLSEVPEHLVAQVAPGFTKLTPSPEFVEAWAKLYGSRGQ